MPRLLIVLAVAVPLGLVFSAYNARLYRRRARRLDAILAVLAAMPGEATASEFGKALSLSAFKFGTMYADLELLERRGRIGHRWDTEAKRMYWFAISPKEPKR